MRGPMQPPLNKEAAEKMFNRKASPDTELPVKEFLKKNPPIPIKKIGAKVVDKMGDLMSYPARRRAQKSMIESDRKFKELRGNRMGEKVGKAVGKIGSASLPAQRNALKQLKKY